MDAQLIGLYATHGSFTAALTTLEQQTRQWIRESNINNLNGQAKTERKKLKHKMMVRLALMQELAVVDDAIKLDSYLSEARVWNDKFGK